MDLILCYSTNAKYLFESQFLDVLSKVVCFMGTQEKYLLRNKQAISMPFALLLKITVFFFYISFHAMLFFIYFFLLG